MDAQNVSQAGETVKYGFLIRCQAKPGKEAELEQLMKNAIARIRQEPGTVTWFAFRFGQSEFGVLDSFYDEEGREAHWEASSGSLDHLQPLIVEGSISVSKIDIVAAKL
jgi:quinol monooxygenase YgiN